MDMAQYRKTGDLKALLALEVPTKVESGIKSFKRKYEKEGPTPSGRDNRMDRVLRSGAIKDALPSRLS